VKLTATSLAHMLLTLTLASGSTAALADEKPEKKREKPAPAEKPKSEEQERAAAEKRRITEKPASPPQLKERLNDLLAQARDAEADGNRERLEDLKAQIREVEQLLKRATGTPEIPPEFRPQAERLELLARRTKHVRIAAENLKAAEMHDLAHELSERAEAMERELAHAKQQLMQHIQSPAKSPRPDADEVHRELQALREENQQLQKKLRELSEQR
jgi:hypothetical protein